MCNVILLCDCQFERIENVITYIVQCTYKHIRKYGHIKETFCMHTCTVYMHSFIADIYIAPLQVGLLKTSEALSTPARPNNVVLSCWRNFWENTLGSDRRGTVHTLKHSCINEYIHACILACVHKYIHACMHTCIHTCMRTVVHIYMHEYIHRAYET